MKYRQILCIFAHETYGSFVNEEMFDIYLSPFGIKESSSTFKFQYKKTFTELTVKVFHSVNGRSGGIRTHDLFHPKEALYQAEPRPETQVIL